MSSVALREVDDDDQARQQLDDTLKKPVKLAKRQHRSANSEVRPVAVTKSWEAKVLAVGTESGAPRRVGMARIRVAGRRILARIHRAWPGVLGQNP